LHRPGHYGFAALSFREDQGEGTAATPKGSSIADLSSPAEGAAMKSIPELEDESMAMNMMRHCSDPTA
jgi:hypothetical protein